MNNKIRGALWGSFCADAYALGSHWEYNTKNIEDASLDWKGYNRPITKYHKGKKAGDFTHYGDQTMWLLEHAVDNGSFNRETFLIQWADNMSTYTGYTDHASKVTMERIRNGVEYRFCGSNSEDISAAGRMAPLLLLYHDDPKAFKRAAKMQAALTHNNEEVIQAAGFFAETAYELLNGKNIIQSIENITPKYDSKIQGWVNKGLNSTGKKTSLTIKRFGQACSTSSVFPGIIHIISKYTNNYPLAMEENCRSGGDSAARGMITGMILGIINGEEAIPDGWKRNLSVYKRLDNLIRTGISRSTRKS